MKGGTYNWYDEKYDHENLRKENDFFGLEEDLSVS